MFNENTMSFNKLTAKTFTEAPPPHFSCLVRTATEELSNSDTRHLLAPTSSSLSSPKRLSSVVFSHISPQSSALSPTTSSLLSPTLSATSRNRERRKEKERWDQTLKKLTQYTSYRFYQVDSISLKCIVSFQGSCSNVVHRIRRALK